MKNQHFSDVTQDQIAHISILNTYNVITGRVPFEDIINSGVGVFAHNVNDGVSIADVMNMIDYFKELEMYEECAELRDFVLSSFEINETEFCQCKLPDIREYQDLIKCNKCKLPIS